MFCNFAPMRQLLILSLLLLSLSGFSQQTVAESGQKRPLIESSLSYRRYTTNDGLPHMQAETFFQDSRGYIYIGTLSGFVRYDGITFTSFLKGKKWNIIGFIESATSEKSFWYRFLHGEYPTIHALSFRSQFILNGNELETQQIDPQRQWLLNNFNTPDLPAGYLLLENENEEQRRLCKMTDKGIQIVLKSAVFDKMEPDRKLYIDSTDIYVPTREGLYCITRHPTPTIHHLSTKSNIYTLCRQGTKLYAFADDGIYLVINRKLEKLQPFHFEAPDYGLYVRSTQQGQQLIADSHTIYCYDGQTVRQLATGFNLIKSLFIDRWNQLWVATYQGVYQFFNMNFVNHQLTDKNDIVQAVAIGPDGRVVCGTLNGTVFSMKTDGTDIQQHSTIEGNFYAPGAARIGNNIYMAGKGDVACFDGKELKWLHLPNDNYRFVTAIGGKLIIGTPHQLLSYDPDTQHLSSITQDIMHPWAVADDHHGNLYVGATSGLYKVESGRWKVEGIGLKEEVEGGLQKLVVTTMDNDLKGNIYFASADSLFLIRNGNIEDLTSQMPQLASHEIRSVHVSPRGYLIVAVLDGMFVARVNERCEISDTHFFNYANGFTTLGPLKATMAEAPDGTIWLTGVEEMTSFNPADLLAHQNESTIVKAPLLWWQHWWFWLLPAALIAIIIWILSRHYEKRHNRLVMQRLQREKKQKELQMNAIRLKNIPHFHANVLAGIEYFIMNNSSEDAMHYLKLYSNFANQILADLERPARTVAEEIENVKVYLELEKLRYGDRLTYTIDVDNHVNTESLLPTMLLHTYCQNAVKHGIGNKPEGGHITISIKQNIIQDIEMLVVRVQDNGVGRAEATRLNKNSTKQGLKILLEQIQLYNQVNQHHIHQQVTDLYDEQDTPNGTCFEMLIPVDYKF